MRKGVPSGRRFPAASPRATRLSDLLRRPLGVERRSAAAHPHRRRRIPSRASHDRFSRALELRSWLEAVANISAAVNNMGPLDDVLDAIASTTCDLLGYDFGAVLLADHGGTDDRLLIRGSHGLSRAYVESINTTKPIRIGRGKYGEGPSSRAFRTHRPTVVRDYQRDASLGLWAGVATEQGYHSLVSVPLVVSSRAIGTLNCYTSVIHDFSEDEVLLLVTIANQAAIAIEAARLREHERATILHLEEARRSYQTQAEILGRSEEIHHHLTQTVLGDGGLEAIAGALSTILAGSVVIDDMAGSVLAASGSGETLAEVPSALLEDAAAARCVDDAVEGREPAELTETQHPSFGTRTFLAPVYIGREVVARLWVFDAARGLLPLERRALEHGVTVVALELLKQRIASEVEGRLRGELLDDLLSGRVLDLQALRGRAGLLGHDLTTRHAALVAGIDHHSSSQDLPAEAHASGLRRLHSIVQSTLRLRQAGALVGQRDGQIVILLGSAERWEGRGITELADQIRGAARRYAGEMSVSVAIGPWVAAIPEFLRSYRIAHGALAVSQRTGGRDRSLSLDDLGVFGLLLAVDRLDELVAFADRSLDPLREYDRRKGSELIGTLREYLDNGCRTADTAAALIVHPNTVAYRVRRIETLLGLDLGRRDAQLHMQLALIVEDVVSVDRRDGAQG